MMKRIFVMGISFGLAVCVADLVALALWWPSVEEAPSAAVLILLYIAIFAALPGLVFIIISEIVGNPSWFGHMVAGGCVAIFANIVFFFLTAHGFQSESHVWPHPSVILSGAAGGLVYWRFAVEQIAFSRVHKVPSNAQSWCN